jgi:hypothetical protein
MRPFPKICIESRFLPFSKEEVLDYITEQGLLDRFVDPEEIKKTVFDTDYLIAEESGTSVIYTLYYRERGYSKKIESFLELKLAVMAKLEIFLFGSGVSFRKP